MAVAVVAGCAHYPLTEPLPPQKPAARYAFEQIPAPDTDDDLFVCLTFSGGGTRAAAFSYGVLQKLRDTSIVRAKDGRHETLLDEVDCISSVSGGSFTAAYYALFGARIFQDYRSVFLDRDVEGELFWKAANPFNWPRLLSPYFSRIDLAAELYGSIFQNKTYADLLTGARRPFIILNATDLATGDGFEFTQDQFDLIGSNLAGLPIARAVAASSAFPFLLTPITFSNHAEPGWYKPPVGLKHATNDYYVNRRRYTWASHQATYLDKEATPYVHVMDGGLADNIGLRALERQLVDPTGFVSQRYNKKGKASQLIFIVVDSKSGEPSAYNQSESAPGLADVAFKTATTSMDNFSAETIEFLRDRQRELDQARQDIEACKQVACKPGDVADFAGTTEIHVIDVNLEAIADPERRKRLLSIGTNFSLHATDVDQLIAAAGDLLDQNPDFKRLLTTLRPAPAPTTAP